MKALPYPTYLIRVFDATRKDTRLHVHRRADLLLQEGYGQRKALGGGVIAFGTGNDKGEGRSAVIVIGEELACIEHHSEQPPRYIPPSSHAMHKRAIERLKELGYDGREPECIWAWPDLVLITIWPSKQAGLVVAVAEPRLLGDHGLLLGLSYEADTAQQCMAKEEAEETKVF